MPTSGWRVGVDVVVLRQSHLLLGRAFQPAGARRPPWNIPLTDLRDGEDVLAAAKRCLLENTGFPFEGNREVLDHRLSHGERAVSLVVLLDTPGTAAPLDPSKNVQWRWFPLCALPEKIGQEAAYGAARAMAYVEKRSRCFFDRAFLRNAISPWMSKVNDQVLGADVGQYSFLSAKEIARVLEVLGPRESRPAFSDAVLEIGAGCGGLAFEIATQLCMSVVALDPSAVALLSLTMAARAKRMDHVRGFRGHASRLEDMDDGTTLPDAQFVAVVGADFSYFISDFASCASEAFRVLRPGGWFLFYATCPSTDHGISDALVCGPFMATAKHLADTLSCAGFGDILVEDGTPGFAEIVEKYLRFTQGNRIALEGDLGKDAVGQWLEEFGVEKKLLARGEMIRCFFRARKPD